ncbi:MAG: SUMF1/EgtB/PvdO family nonheme iron enzyme [Polyangiaceae bacterium]|jgi:formylglycine-generating enzyme required for sulfatase activity
MRNWAARFLCGVACSVGASGCAAILGIEEQTWNADGGDGNSEWEGGSETDGPADAVASDGRAADAGSEAAPAREEGGADSTVTDGEDAGGDATGGEAAAADGPPPTEPDVSGDSAVDVAGEATGDASLDATPDSGQDASAIESGIQAGPDSSGDQGLNPPRDGGNDTTATDDGMVAAADAAVDAGADAAALETRDGAPDAPDTSVDGAGDSSPCDAAAAVCSYGATLCAGNAIQTCDSCGQWGTALACGAATPYCATGACSATPPVPPSCQGTQGGQNNCGAGAESCCTSPLVDGGTYSRTYSYDGGVLSGEADPAKVSSFRLDKYLVTVGRFRKFSAAWTGGWQPQAGSGKHAHLNGGAGLNATVGGYEPGWVSTDTANIAPTDGNLLSCDETTWTSTPGTTQEILPVNCVNWWEAYAFCIWDSGFLPSEAEWEYASAGGSQQLEYPWGSTDPGSENEYAIYGDYYPYLGANQNGLLQIAPVGTAAFGQATWGQLDMAGEVYEWVLDWYALSYANPCTDCAYLSITAGRSIRGGMYGDIILSLLSGATRTSDTPATRYGVIGFRCARSP